MTSRERLLCALRGEAVDHVPWAPFLTYWWDNNRVAPAERLGELGFKRAVGCDLLMRGHCDRPDHLQYEDLAMFRKEYGHTIEREEAGGDRKYTIYETPLGILRAGYIYSPSGDTWFLQEHPVKTEEDLKILAYIAGDIRLTADNTAYERESAQNPDTLFVPLITPFNKTAFQSMIEYWVGTEELSYALMDYPEAVEEALEAMQRISLEAARISAASPAQAFISWEDTSTTNISPAWYEKYILPEINGWCDILHTSGKLYIQHACGHLRELAPMIAASSIDAIESVSAPPTGNITPWDLSDILPAHIAIISGIEPTFFINAGIPELEAHVDFLCRRFEGKRFVMANADSCPPEVDIDKFGVVSKRVYENAGLTPPPIARFDKSDIMEARGVSAYHGTPTSSKEEE